MYNLDTEIVKTLDEISSVLSALAANDATPLFAGLCSSDS